MEPVHTLDRPVRTVLGLGYSVLVDSETTDGAYELMRFVAPPNAGPPPHKHDREDEMFLIQEGVFEISLGDETITAKPGDFVHLPRGTVHSFVNVGGTPGSFLCWVMPGNLEGFFAAFEAEWSSEDEMPPPPTDEMISTMLKVCPDFGIEISG